MMTQQPNRGGPRIATATFLSLVLILLLLGPSGCATTQPTSALNTIASSPKGSQFEAVSDYREWARRSKGARIALQRQRYPEAQFELVAALDSLRIRNPSDVRVQATLGHLVRLAAIYGRLERKEEAERVMQTVTQYASRPPESATSPYRTAGGGTQTPSGQPLTAEALRYDALYRDWLSRPLENGFRPVTPETAEKSVPDLETLIAQTASAYRVDPLLVKAVVAAESNFETHAVSSAGAQGLMQLMPATAREMGVRSPFVPRDNLRGGVRYLRKLLDRYTDLEPALAAYNAGPGAVDRYGGIPPYPETEAYIERVMSFYKGYRDNALD